MTPRQVGIELLERIGGDAVLQAAGISGCFVGGDPGVAQQPLEETMPDMADVADVAILIWTA